MYMFLMRDEQGRKKEASKVKQANKAKQHSTPEAVTFPKKNELPRVGLEPTTLLHLQCSSHKVREVACVDGLQQSLMCRSECSGHCF